MYLVLLMQNGDNHAINYQLPSGNYKTICGLMIKESCLINKVILDNTFNNLCQTCKSKLDLMYNVYLNNSTRMVRNQSTNHLYQILGSNLDGIEGPSSTYHEVENRSWYKLTKYKRLLSKAKRSLKKDF